MTRANPPVKPKGPPLITTDRSGIFDKYRKSGPPPVTIDGECQENEITGNFINGLIAGLLIGLIAVLLILGAYR